MEAADVLARYSRQTALRVVGREGQERLAAARMGLIGCGALGSVIAGHLVRAGVGYLRIVDGDYPELCNLHRQMIFTEVDVARRVPKAEAAAAHLRMANSDVVVEASVAALDRGNLTELLDGLDVVLDGTDNFPTRFLINEFMVERGKPWVYGGVMATSGMSMTVVPGEGPCLCCLVPEPPGEEQTRLAERAGVLGTAAAVVGSIEATEAIKLVVDPTARNRGLLVVDVWDQTLELLDVPRDPACRCCGSGVVRE